MYRYFMMGEVFGESEKASESYRWYYNNDKAQPLYSCWVEPGMKHCLPEVLSNNFILKKYFGFDIKKVESPESTGDEITCDFGQPFSKNIYPATSIHFYPERNDLVVNGQRTYSRRTDGKPRYYPAIYIANRIRWFLKVNPFVESFKEEKRGLVSIFKIKFAPQFDDVKES